MSDYFDNSSRWVYDRDGNYLHSSRRKHNPNEIRDGYFVSDYEKEQEEEYLEYLYKKENNLL